MIYKIHQKIISSFLIFLILFGITFRWSEFSFFPNKAQALNKEFFNLVSIIVDDNIYDDVKSRLERYSRDIEGVLDNTKVVIIPTPKNASAFEIASLNESLYNEGYKSVKKVDFESKLVGTVLVGSLPLPIVSDGNNYSKTILPYTDFENKSFVFNHKTGIYEKSSTQGSNLKPEIWHGFVSPNTGNEDDNIKSIKDFFDKNHDYYAGKNQFDTKLGVMNGNKEDKLIDGYKPYVFYFDQFREEKSIDYSNYKGYESRRENLEDLVYNRYSTQLAKKIKEQVLGESNAEMKKLVEEAFPELVLSGVTSTSGDILDGASDITTKYITNNTTKRFLEIFNSSTLGDLKQNIYNAGRYSDVYDQVNGDFTPFLISVIDLISEQVIKNANDDLEIKIDNLVKNGLSRKIPVLVSYSEQVSCASTTYTNYFYGIKGSDVKEARDCSIYRGSLYNGGTLVESNRGYNVNNANSDSKIVSACGVSTFKKCGSDTSCLTRGYWGGNSPLNIDISSKISGKNAYNLKTHNIYSSITPLYDAAGSIFTNDSTKTPSPLNCFSGVPIMSNKKVGDYLTSCSETFNLYTKNNWACYSDNSANGTVSYGNFYDVYNNKVGGCTKGNFSIDGNYISTLGPLAEDDVSCYSNYEYKTIPSILTHKSPLPSELKAQNNSMFTPSLSIDKDRYVDFIGVDGKYKKINYPYLYRIADGKKSNFKFEDVENLLKVALENKSLEINNLIKTSSSGDSIWKTYLKTGPYPSADIDLLKGLKDKPLKVYKIDGDEKEISYYDTLVFAIYWKSLNSVSSKYKFIFENYLSDQFSGSSHKFLLPKNKKMYEMSYIGAPGDAQNMYIKIDPESKKDNPYTDLISNNSNLNNLLLGAGVSGKKSTSYADSKCAPPEGVPLWQWFPAVICRLGTMMPPSIKISDGNCGGKNLFLSKDELDKLNSCDGDLNKNGINDCIETKLDSGSLELTSDSNRYYYSSYGKLNVLLKDKEGNILNFDNSTDIKFELEKIDLLGSDSNSKKTIFDKNKSTLNDRKDIEDNYFSFKDLSIKVSGGEASYGFYSRNKDLDAYIGAYAEIKDFKGTRKIFLGNTIKIEVRGDNFVSTNYKITNDNDKLELVSGSDGVLVSDTINLFLVDGKHVNIDDIKNTINNSSLSKEKLILSLENYTKAGNKLDLSFPLLVEIYKGENEDDVKYEKIDSKVLTSTDLVSFKSLASIKNTGVYSIKIKDKFGFGFTKTFQLLPEKANSVNLELGSSVLETGNVLTTHFVTIYDKYGNVANGDIYTIEGNINGNGLLFDENLKNTLKSQTLEGYKVFRLRSTQDEDNNKLTFKIKDTFGNQLLQTSKNVKTIKNVALFVKPLQSKINVGGAEYSFEISARDQDGKIISDFNSRAYLNINDIYGVPLNSYFDIKNGVGVVKFFTKTTSSREVKLEFQVEGLKSIYSKYIEILPDTPIKIDLSLTRNKIEASSLDYTYLKAELKDRYGNLVYNDNSTNLSLELKDDYKYIIKPELTSIKVNSGVATFKINATDTPGIAYIKISANPKFKSSFELEGQAPFGKDLLDITGFRNDKNLLTDLGKKFFEEYNLDYYKSKFYTLQTLIDSEDYKSLSTTSKIKLKSLWLSNNKIIVEPQSENAIKLETFYFWNKSKIGGNSYNTLYTTLLGSNYGDITQENYLAGSLLFDKNNRSLAVTSILNNPYRTADTISINSKGKVSTISDSKDLTQDIKFIPSLDKNKKVYFDIYNEALSVYVGKIYYNFDNGNNLNVCNGPSVDFSDCKIDNKKTSISMKTISKEYNSYYEGNSLILKNSFGTPVFTIDEDGNIAKNTSITIDKYDLDSSSKATISIKSGKDIVAIVGFNIVDGKFSITRDYKNFDLKLKSLKNSILLYLDTYSYGIRDVKSQDGSIYMIYYNDPFGDTKSLDNFSENSNFGIENFETEKNVGWASYNKSLLLFASGENVGDSTKKYQSFSLINLGDPVISLKSVQKKLPGKTLDRKFDSVIGKLISGDKKNVGYKVFDYNGDNKEDIVLVKSDSYLGLLENKDSNGKFIDMGNLVYLPEIGQNGTIEVGDFTGDNFDDIFYIASGKPYLLNNREKKFTKIYLEDKFNLKGDIIQTSAYDLDLDGKTDIVTLDSSGEINIFYGSGTSENPEFTKLKIGDGYAPYLGTGSRDDGGAVYFTGLYSMNNEKLLNDIITTNEELQSQLKTSTNSISKTTDTIDERFIDNIIFENIPYSPEKKDFSGELNTESISKIKIDSQANSELGNYAEQTKNQLTELSNYSSGTINIDQNNTIDNTTFVKSQYSENYGIKVEKTFTDVNSGSLKSGDIVKVQIKLINTSGLKKSNVAYAETIEKYFSLNGEESIKTTNTGGLLMNVGNYDFIIDGFSIPPGKSFNIEYEVTTLPLKYAKIETGLFELGEVGNDTYGDILVKTDDSSCATDADLYRSVGIRSYDKGTTKLTCDADKLKLPGDLEKNKTDNDGNGIPDYIDELTKSSISGDTATLAEYSNKALNDITKDKDGDGMPDGDDSTPGYDNNNKDSGSFLDEMNNNVDNLLLAFDYISKGLCKGFGGGSCLSTPLNWAPLAPGSDPTIFGFPIGDGLKVGEGLPVFAFPTIGFPPVWPPNSTGAGGRFDGSPTGLGISQFRLFVTPTLTGAAGIAICFGPNASAWSWFPGLYPLMPGGQCIVAAMPLSCRGDGSDGDPKQKNYPINRGNFDTLNGSCQSPDEISTSKYFKFDSDFVNNYIKFKSGNKSELVVKNLKDTFKTIATEKKYILSKPSAPLISVGAGNDPDSSMGNFSVDIDTNSLKNFNISDAIKIKNTWITDFPAFLMDWVDRQVEEVVTKLTSFPSLIVILPDFSGIYDNRWGNFIDNMEGAFAEGKAKDKKRDDKVNKDLENVKKQQESNKCSDKSPGDNGYTDCMILSTKGTGLDLRKQGPESTISGVKSVYEFLGNLPLIAFQSQTVNVNLPWPDEATLTKGKISFEMTKKQRGEEIEKAKQAWSLGKECNQTVPEEKESCEKENEIGTKLIMNAGTLLKSLDQNIETIEDYKKTPEKVVGLLNKKEERLQQVMCNVDTISTLIGGRIGKNGDRFKSWVESFILIKASLKSWQLLIDLFVDYETSCKKCKNERNDLWTFIWKLISMIIPKIPVIQFPKWPNVVVDLHNVKAGMNIALPEFNLNVRPMVLPTLPKLVLPKVPSASTKLPELPLLPKILIGKLPDLPTLPSIKIPDLPPAPKLPKIIGALQGVLNILKLVTKIMCFLRTSILVPEWRAGDQIANITERQGFMAFDFLDISMPQFSFPFVNAIKVSSFVNYENDTSFLTEMAKQSTQPLNTFTNDISNLFKIKIGDLDFSNTVPVSDVNVDIKTGKTSMNYIEENKKIVGKYTKFMAYGLFKLITHIEKNKNIQVTPEEYLVYVNQNLSDKSIVSDPRNDKIRKLWQDISSMTYSNEDKIIKNLQDNQKEKFDLVKTIIKQEITKTQKQKEYIKNLIKPNSLKFVDYENKSNVDEYNKLLDKHNSQTVKATINLLNDKNDYKKELEKDGNDLKNKLKGTLSNYKNSLLADSTISKTPAASLFSDSTTNSCSYGSNYKYNYKGIYILENGVNYRLFDYLDDLKGDEKITTIDFDSDGDEDLLYMVKGEIFLKENFEKNNVKKNIIYEPLELSISNNKFFNGNNFYESLNNTKESISSNGFINFSFDSPLIDGVSNFRLELFTIVDKFLNQNYDSYIPKSIKKEIIDSFEGIDDSTIDASNVNYDIRNNLAYITNVGNNIKNTSFETKEMINIRKDILLGKIVSISDSTKLYSGNNPFTIKYYTDSLDDKKELTLSSHQNVQFNDGVKITSIIGDAYIEGINKISFKGEDIKNYLGLPLMPGLKIIFDGDSNLLTEASHIDLRYYDGTETYLDFREIQSYNIYDLGIKSDSHIISTQKNNDFYYSKISSFKNNIFGTKSTQVLLSPQLSSDREAPKIELDSTIMSPVYMKKDFDFTDYINEDTGIKGIKDFYIDFDLENDSDKDGNARNDRDLENIKINKTPLKITATFGPFDKLFTKKIRLNIEDQSGNKGYKDVDFEVYTPLPRISNISDGKILGEVEDELDNLPINFYRYRGGVISKLEDETGKFKINTSSGGLYQFKLKNYGIEGLTLTKDGSIVAFVSEKTGKIILKDLSSLIKVLPSNSVLNDTSYVKFIIRKSDEDIYSQYFNYEKNNSLSVVDNFDNLTLDGIYLKFDNKSDYSYSQIPLNALYNPGSIYIYSVDSKSKTPLFTIFMDGRINTLSPAYKLEYFDLGNNIGVKLYDEKSGKYIASILFKMTKGNYIMK